MKKLFLILLCAGVIAAGAAVTFALYLSKPEAAIEPSEKIHPLVVVQALDAMDVEMKLPSQGLVEAKHNTMLAAEVSGKIIKISEHFESGGEFAEGDVILEIDPADYEARLAEAEAALEEAKLALQTEKAKAKQAERDWKALGNGGEASQLTLRVPQLASATAKIKAAEAARDKADRDLKRTLVRAPYAARVEKTEADLGAFVSTGTPLVRIHSLGPYEVRLPLSLDEYAFVVQGSDGKPRSEAELSVAAAGETFAWDAKVVRTEGMVERSSRSIHLVAEVEAEESGAATFLQPGLFVDAAVDGITLKNVYRIPLQAFRKLDEIVVVSADDKLFFRVVQVIWREPEFAIVEDVLKDGDPTLRDGERVLMTEIPDVVEGMPVRIDDSTKDKPDDNSGEAKLAAESDPDTDKENSEIKP